MNRVQATVNKVLDQQKLQLAPSTYVARKNYLLHLATHAEQSQIDEPCQELYDSYIARASTPELRFQLLHAVRLVDKEAGSKAFTPEGKLYNEPEFPPPDESEKIFQSISFPIADGSVDTGHLIHRAESEMDYLQLSYSTRWQYMQAWRELYIFLYLREDTTFSRDNCNAFIEDTIRKHQFGLLHGWKRKIRRRATLVLLEVADTGNFKWKLFLSRKVCCAEESLEELRQQYLAFLRTQNLENRTIALYDYAFRSLVEGSNIGSVSKLATMKRCF